MMAFIFTLWLGNVKIDYVCADVTHLTMMRKTIRPNGVDIIYYSECRSA